MWTRDGFSSDEVPPFSLFSYQLTDFLPQSSAIDISVPSVDLANLQRPRSSNNYPNGYNPAFSMPLSHGRSDFIFRNPLSPQFTRPCSPDWLSLDHRRTNPGEIERSCQSPSLCNQFSEFEKGNQGHVKGSDDDGALDDSFFRSFFSKIKEARNVPTPTELTDEIDECLATHLEGPKDFNDEIARCWRESCEISNKNKMQNEFCSQEKGSTGLVTKSSVSSSVSQKCDSVDEVNDGQSGVGKQVIEENNFMFLNRNSSCRCKDVDCKFSDCSGCSWSQEEENQSMSENRNSSCSCKDIDYKFSDCSECCWAQEEKDYLFSPSSVAVAPEKASASVPAPKLDIRMLVKMMHNMSELLHYHHLTDEFLLNEQDCGMLENVTSNLRTCTLKDAEQIIPAQKRVFSESDSENLGGQSPQLQQNSLVKEPHMSKAGAEHANVDPYIYLMSKVGAEHANVDPYIYLMSKVGAEHANIEHAGDAMGSLGLGDNFKPDQIQGSQHEGDNSTVFGTNMEADEHGEAPILIRPRDLKIKDLSNSVDSCADDMEPILALEGTESPKTQNQDGSDASESLSLMDDDTDPETLDSSDACDVSESTWDLEDNQEMQSGSCHTSGNELVSDDSDGSLSDWELV